MTTVKTDLGIHKRQAHQTRFSPTGNIAATDEGNNPLSVSVTVPAGGGVIIGSCYVFTDGTLGSWNIGTEDKTVDGGSEEGSLMHTGLLPAGATTVSNSTTGAGSNDHLIAASFG